MARCAGSSPTSSCPTTRSQFDGLTVLEWSSAAPHVPFIFVSGTIGEEVAIDSLKRGAADYIIKNNMGAWPLRFRAPCRMAATAPFSSRSRELREVQERFSLSCNTCRAPRSSGSGRASSVRQRRLRRDDRLHA